MPKEPLLHIVGILGAGPHQESSDLGMLVGLEDGTTAVLRIKLSLLSGLSLVLRNYLAKATYTDEAGMVAPKPMQLDSCQPFLMMDGQVGMVLDVEHMRLPIAFPVDAVPTLVEGLNRMVELSRVQPTAPSVN
ncbi:MAG: hypothetical protein ACREHF_04525 [Rhizomicrobium sp.]